MGRSKRGKKRKGRSEPARRPSAGRALLGHGLVILSLAYLMFELLLSAQTYHRHGTLVSVDAATHTLIVRTPPSDRHVAYQWDASTRFLELGAPVRLDALRVGGSLGLVYQRGGPPYVLTKVYLAGGLGNPE